MITDTAPINAMINIREVAEAAGANFKGNKSHCFIHGGDNPGAFEIFDNGRAWKCWTHESECNKYGYDGIGLLRILNGWSFNEVKERYTSNPIDPDEAKRRELENAKRIEDELQHKIEEAQKAIEDLRKRRRWIEDHDRMSKEAIAMWEKRGVPQEFQDFWKLGYRESFAYTYAGEHYTSPTLTIPIFGWRDDEPRQIQHRLLAPHCPTDKYRPERAGIDAMCFLGDRDLPIDVADRIIIVEGQIKAAVTFATLDKPLLQVIGLPGKNQRKSIWPSLAKELQGHDVCIFPDPDAGKDGRELADMIGGARIINLPDKIDDMINANLLDKYDILGMMNQARR